MCLLLKRTFSLLLALFLASSLCPAADAATIIGHALYSDIVAEINGHPLRSYIVDGHVAVVAEDLCGYGFSVAWSAKNRTLRITRDTPPPAVWPDYQASSSTHAVGEPAAALYRSGIKVYVDGKQAAGYNIGGETLIRLDSLSAYGKSTWDAATRTSNLTLDPYRPKQPLYILMYHEITEDSVKEFSDWMTTKSLFRRDLQWLSDHGYTSYLPSEIISGQQLSDKAVLITFDDGYMSNYTLALPILQEFGMKAVISLVGSYMDNANEGYLTWDACREMAKTGLIEFGSHTYALHTSGMRRRSGEQRDAYVQRVSDDLRQSADIIQEQLGQKVVFFAYPHGWRDSWGTNIVREQFAMTVTTAHGAAEVSRNLYDLPRYNINTKQPVSMFLR